MARTIENPLTPEDHKRIRDDRNRLARLRKLTDRIENCGINCQENRDLLHEMDDFLARVETEFFHSAVPD